MGDEDRVQAQLKEVAQLFQEVYQVLTRAKCRVTALAAFNRAQTILDELERDPNPEIARAVKEARGATRQAVGKEKSLHHVMQVHAMYWKEAV
jgi:GTP1/Obg family GTP-binding protein